MATDAQPSTVVITRTRTDGAQLNMESEPPHLLKSALKSARWTPLTDEEREQSQDRMLELNTLFKLFGIEGNIHYGKPGWPPLVIYVRRDEQCSQHFYPPTFDQVEKIVQVILRGKSLAPAQGSQQ